MSKPLPKVIKKLCVAFQLHPRTKHFLDHDMNWQEELRFLKAETPSSPEIFRHEGKFFFGKKLDDKVYLLPEIEKELKELESLIMKHLKDNHEALQPVIFSINLYS